MEPLKPRERPCENCGKPYQSWYSQQRICGAADCKRALRNARARRWRASKQPPATPERTWGGKTWDEWQLEEHEAMDSLIAQGRYPTRESMLTPEQLERYNRDRAELRARVEELRRCGKKTD